MPRVRKIKRSPDPARNYFVVDASFLTNGIIPPTKAPNTYQRQRIERCNEWWTEIHDQLNQGKARVYIPDICIAEAFKALAKKYYKEHWFATPVELNNARLRLRQQVRLPPRLLRAAKRRIKFHDVPTTRDIILAVDRFYELFLKHGKSVSLPDLIVLATAKYLIDFFDVPKRQIHIVTLDKELWEGSKKIPEIPNAYDPTRAEDFADRVFQ
jgi:hypothetical protein